MPNVAARRTSSDMVVITPTGPHAKGPANAPIEVGTEGTIVVKSISDTFTPGES